MSEPNRAQQTLLGQPRRPAAHLHDKVACDERIPNCADYLYRSARQLRKRDEALDLKLGDGPGPAEILDRLGYWSEPVNGQTRNSRLRGTLVEGPEHSVDDRPPAIPQQIGTLAI